MTINRVDASKKKVAIAVGILATVLGMLILRPATKPVAIRSAMPIMNAHALAGIPLEQRMLRPAPLAVPVLKAAFRATLAGQSLQRSLKATPRKQTLASSHLMMITPKGSLYSYLFNGEVSCGSACEDAKVEVRMYAPGIDEKRWVVPVQKNGRFQVPVQIIGGLNDQAEWRVSATALGRHEVERSGRILLLEDGGRTIETNLRLMNRTSEIQSISMRPHAKDALN